MSAQNVEIVRTLFAYWGTRDAGRAFELLADDVEMQLERSLPGFADVQRGHAAVRAFWLEWLVAWEKVTVRDFELRDGDGQVLGIWTQDMRGRGGDVVMEEHQAAIFTLRDGKVTRVRYFDDPAQAEAEFAR